MLLIVLVIREAQLWTLGQNCRQLFEDRMMEHLRTHFPHCDFTHHDDPLRRFVVEGMELAKTFGVATQFDLRRFLEFRAEYGAEFHQLPWAAKILNDKTLSGCGKMEQIDDYSLYVLRPDS